MNLLSSSSARRPVAILVALSILLVLQACGRPKGNLEAGIAAFERKDYAAALKEIESVAESGDGKAQYYMALLAGERSTSGVGDFNRRDANVIVWLRKSAESGYADAQYRLGGLLLRGAGIAGQMHDVVEGEKWLLKAADQGHVGAWHDLGQYYGETAGPARDPVAAYALARAAAARESRYRIHGEPWVARDMDEQQVEAGQALAKRILVLGAVVSQELGKSAAADGRQPAQEGSR